jgi:hypothetical protein
MSRESAPGANNIGQLKEDGSLGPIEEACILRAEKTFKIRSKIDTNPVIVQMVLRGKPIDHWYYRSDQWIDQPYFALGNGLQPYIGPANRAQRFMYGEGKFIVDKEATEDAIEGY